MFNKVCYSEHPETKNFHIVCFVDKLYQEEMMFKFPQLTQEIAEYPRGELTPEEYLAFCLAFPKLKHEHFY